MGLLSKISTQILCEIIHINNLDEKILNKIRLNAFNKAIQYNSKNNAKIFQFLTIS